MNQTIIFPIIIPLIAAGLSVLLYRNIRMQRILAVISSAAQLASGIWLLRAAWLNGVLVLHVGSWPAPYGITLAADLFSALMVVLTGFMGFVVLLYSLDDMDEVHNSAGFYIFYPILLTGVSGAFLTGGIFNLYVFFEIMLIASFVLLSIGGDRPQLEGAIKYMALNLLSSSLFLAGAGILYGVMGTLNMADLAVKLRAVSDPGFMTLLATLFLIAFGIKAAVFPLFFWLPASYHTPPSAVSAIFAALLTKVGIYAMIRVFTLMFVGDIPFTHTLILVIAVFTMVSGVLGAAVQYDIKKILSFHCISQIGYILMGLGIFTTISLSGAVYFMLHHAIVKSNLFLISGLVNRLKGTCDLKRIGGLFETHPFLSVLFLCTAFSLTGLPPLSGFFAKFLLIKGGLKAHSYLAVSAALSVSLLTAFSMTKIWAEAFWKTDPESPNGAAEATAPRPKYFRLTAVFILTLAALCLGIFADPVIRLTDRVAFELLHPDTYIRTVLE